MASATFLDQALDAAFGGSTTFGYISAHTADPGNTGASEYAGVTRQAVTWAAASAGTKANSNVVTLTTSGASAVLYIAAQSAVTAGTFGEKMLVAGGGVTATTITFPIGSIVVSAV